MIKGKEAKCLSSSGVNFLAFRTWMYKGNVSQLKAGMVILGVLANSATRPSVGLELDWANRETGMANRVKIQKAILGRFIGHSNTEKIIGSTGQKSYVRSSMTETVDLE